MLATEPRWRGLPLAEALALATIRPRRSRAPCRPRPTGRKTPPDAYVRGEAVMQTETRGAVPRLAAGHLHRLRFGARAGERRAGAGDHGLRHPAGADLLPAVAPRLVAIACSSSANRAELRLLNARLQREIAERERVQKDLEVAEQTLAQSSKLAALGEMSAAVSHELNQPLAAMKTYLAGARLLLAAPPAGRGAVVVPAHRRPDRPDGRRSPGS